MGLGLRLGPRGPVPPPRSARASAGSLRRGSWPVSKHQPWRAGGVLCAHPSHPGRLLSIRHPARAGAQTNSGPWPPARTPRRRTHGKPAQGPEAKAPGPKAQGPRPFWSKDLRTRRGLREEKRCLAGPIFMTVERLAWPPFSFFGRFFLPATFHGAVGPRSGTGTPPPASVPLIMD